MRVGATPRTDALSGVNMTAIHRLAATGWAVGIVVDCLLMIPAPPTAQLGAWGWAAGIGIQAASLAGRLAFGRNRKVGVPPLLTITWVLPLDLGAMQWLPAAGTAVVALAPAVYAPDRDALLGVGTELVIWLFVSSALAMLMTRVRGQARLARRDPLTRLGNRRALDERFVAPRTGDLVLGIGDLDRFKQINDRHGHLAGDACLKAVGAVLAERARTDDQVFRWGGDEFAVLLPATDPGAAATSSFGSSRPSPTSSAIPAARPSASRSAGRPAGRRPTCGRSPSAPTRRCWRASSRAPPPRRRSVRRHRPAARRSIS